MKTGFNEDHLEIDSVSLGSSKVGIYKCFDDSGYCSIFVEQSYAIMPGIKKVVRLATTFPATGAKLTKIDKHHVSCHIEIPKDQKQVSDIIATDL